MYLKNLISRREILYPKDDFYEVHAYVTTMSIDLRWKWCLCSISSVEFLKENKKQECWDHSWEIVGDHFDFDLFYLKSEFFAL